MNTRIFYIPLLLLCFAGCRFKMPTVDEQRALIKDGAFAGNVPVWVAKPAAGGAQTKRSSGSLIPETGFSIANDDNAFNAVESSSRTQVVEKEDNSPLERISNRCTGIESKVNSAITTTNIIERVKKLESLSSQCPLSADLLVWLSEDYIELRDTTAARKTLHTVLSIDASNARAKELLRRINK